jgi:hypothetical protein
MGTITTARPLSQAVLSQPYTPESPWTRYLPAQNGWWIPMAIFTIGALTFAALNPKNTRIFMLLGIIWPPVGWYLITQKHKLPLGYAFFSAGIIYLVWGMVTLWSKYRTSKMAVNT